MDNVRSCESNVDQTYKKKNRTAEEIAIRSIGEKSILQNRVEKNSRTRLPGIQGHARMTACSV